MRISRITTTWQQMSSSSKMNRLRRPISDSRHDSHDSTTTWQHLCFCFCFCFHFSLTGVMGNNIIHTFVPPHFLRLSFFTTTEDRAEQEASYSPIGSSSTGTSASDNLLLDLTVAIGRFGLGYVFSPFVLWTSSVTDGFWILYLMGRMDGWSTGGRGLVDFFLIFGGF